MNGLLKSEFLKLRTTRTAVGLLAGAAVLAAAGVALMFTSDASEREFRPFAEQEFLGFVASIAWPFVIVLGIRAFTDEVRHGSIVPTFLATPGRVRVAVAKLAAVSSWSVATAVAAVGVGSAIAVTVLGSEGASLADAPGVLAGFAGRAAISCVLWAAIGLGVGLVVRHQVAAIVGSFVWIMFAEQLIGAASPGVARFLPATASNNVIGQGGGAMGPVAALIVLATWAVAAMAAGAWIVSRQDVT
jgi:ABC-type transport system involved in multi-copper enzyme maturation permease subunit